MIQESIDFSITINGSLKEEKQLPAHWRLLDYLHHVEHLTGTKYGCGGGFCKACTVAKIDKKGVYHAIPACSTSLEACNGWEIETIEAVSDGDNLHPIQQAFIDRDAFQCGYCTPGFVMEAKVLYENHENSGYGENTIDEVVESALESHLCRCTGYQRYTSAVKEVIKSKPSKSSQVTSTAYIKKWKLIRYLHEAAEVENALLIQYLYAAFSIKVPVYKGIIGQGHRTPGQPHNLLAVAIEEMMHLDTVNRLIVELGGAPNLIRQDLPFEPKLYPFRFEKELLSRKSLAKYIYAEAGADDIDKDAELKEILNTVLPEGNKINRVGSIYNKIITTLEEYGEDSDWSRTKHWIERLKIIQEEGESDHFHFFVQLIKGSHWAFHDQEDIWVKVNPTYESLDLGTAYKERRNSIENEAARELAMLANLHYWVTMAIFELSYRNSCEYHLMARRHMAGPLLQLCFFLPEKFSVLPPFDRCSMDYMAGFDEKTQSEWVLSMLSKIAEYESKYQGVLPSAYLMSSSETVQELYTMMANLEKNNE